MRGLENFDVQATLRFFFLVHESDYAPPVRADGAAADDSAI